MNERPEREARPAYLEPAHDGYYEQRGVIAGNLQRFRAHYWDLYAAEGFTFAEAYQAWITEWYLDIANRPADTDEDSHGRFD